MSRIILLARDGDSTRIVFHALQPDHVILEQPLPSRKLLVRRCKKLGLRKVLGQLAFRASVVPLLRLISKRRIAEIIGDNRLSVAAIPADVVTRVSSVNEDETIAKLRALNPTIIVVNGTRIISERVLQSVDSVFINTHAGITPLYRGVHGAYWALANNQREHCGVTVHMVDCGIDTGRILEQAIIEPTSNDNFVTYPYLQVAVAIPFLKRVIQKASQNDLAPKNAPDGRSRLWTHPTLAEYLKYRLAGVR